MVAYANPEAVDALWASQTSVKSYAMRLCRELLAKYMYPLTARQEKVANEASLALLLTTPTNLVLL